MKFLLQALLILFVSSCSPERKEARTLDKSKLQSQTFTINIDRDTSIVTLGGIIIKLKAGDIASSDGNQVKIKIKEALTISDMVRNGLLTESDGQPLSSGGMFLIDVENNGTTKIKSAVAIFVPTRLYNNNMKVFQGVENENTVNWINPVPLPTIDDIQLKIEDGKSLFENNCASCHKINLDFAGPSLAGITDRLPKKWLYDFTRNPVSVLTTAIGKGENIKGIDRYTCCLFNEWQPTMMTGFPELSDNDLDNIYSFIKSRSDIIQPGDNKASSDCYKCAFSKTANDLIDMPEDVYVDLSRSIEVNNDTITGTYYPLNINSFGWYNIDILLKELEMCTPSELIVDIGNKISESSVRVTLVIPSIRVFIDANRDQSLKNRYTFSDSSSIPLPRGQKCFILSFKEETKDVVEYALDSFIASSVNKIQTKWRKVPVQDFYQKIETLELNSTANNFTKNSLNINDVITSSKNSNKDSIQCGCGNFQK